MDFLWIYQICECSMRIYLDNCKGPIGNIINFNCFVLRREVVFLHVLILNVLTLWGGGGNIILRVSFVERSVI